MKKAYVVYNKWVMDIETWDVYMMKAFTSKKVANEYRDRLEKESGDNDDNFIVEEVDLE